jgi:hypothetical protein
VIVAGAAPDCLKVREGPGLASAELGCLDDGTVATIAAGPVDMDEVVWWQIEGHGWAAADYLRLTDAEDTTVIEEEET